MWALKIVVAALFIAAAGAKLAGVQQMVDEFNQIGLGQWFRYFTGVTEMMTGIFCWFRRPLPTPPLT